MPVAACVLLTFQLTLALALIPPWQQPDEPTHVARVELQRSRIALLDGAPDPGREGEILQSMAAYSWWQHRRVGGQPPLTLPKDFSVTGTGTPATAGGGPPAHPWFAGRVLSWLPHLSVVDDLYLLRTLSAVLGLLTLWVAWLGARECLGALGGAAVAMLLALHPQFAIVSTTASPDAVANLAGACLWWQAAIAVKRTQILPLAAVWAAAILAASADRMGLPLLVFALCVSGVVGIARVRAVERRSTLMISAIAVSGLAAAWAISALGTTFDFNRIFSGGLAPVPGVMTWTSFARFNWLIHQSWWFSLGWGRYTPPAWWTATAAALTVVAVAGVARLLFSRRVDAQTHRLLALAALGIAIQLAAVFWGIYFRLGVGALGRYLLPFLVPSLMLLWSGIETWIPQSRRVLAAAALILLLAVLDVAAWGLVAIPAYYASL